MIFDFITPTFPFLNKEGFPEWDHKYYNKHGFLFWTSYYNTLIDLVESLEMIYSLYYDIYFYYDPQIVKKIKAIEDQISLVKRHKNNFLRRLYRIGFITYSVYSFLVRKENFYKKIESNGGINRKFDNNIRTVIYDEL